MKIAFLMTFISAVLLASPVSAYVLKNQTDQGPCASDGSACDVFCNNGNRAGTMYWNGTVWTDGVKSDPDQDTEARQICAANGSDCI